MNDTANKFAPALNAMRVPPKLAPQARMSPVMLALGVLVVFAASATLFHFNPARYGFYPSCFFHELTGLQCPGCGGTRALYQLLHGHVTTALHLNALLVVSLPLIAWRGIGFTMRRFRQQPMVGAISPTWCWIFLVLTVAFGVLRNLPTFAWLSP